MVERGRLESNRTAAEIPYKIHRTKSERIKGKLRLECTLKDREVKRRAREDRRIWLEKIGWKQRSLLRREEPENCTKQPGKAQTRSIDKLQLSITRMER